MRIRSRRGSVRSPHPVPSPSRLLLTLTAALLALALGVAPAAAQDDPTPTTGTPTPPTTTAAPTTGTATPATPATPGAFVPLQAARLFDSRDGSRVVDRGFARAPGPVGPGDTVAVPVAGRGGVPDVGAGTVVLDVTGTSLFGASFMTVWPQGAPRPPTSTLPLSPSEPVSRTIVTKLGDGGAVSLFNVSGLADATVDVVGWFPENSPVVSGVPQRVLDTRTDGGPLAPGTARSVGVDGKVARAPAGSSVLVELTATDATAPAALATWPVGGTRPVDPVLRVEPDRTVSTMTVVAVGPGGAIDVGALGDAATGGAADLLVDVVAVLPASVGRSLAPARVFDTRPGVGTVDGAGAGSGSLAPGASRTVPVLGRGGVPATGVSSVLLTVTGIAPAGSGAVGAWGSGPPPTTSAVVVPGGATRSGFAVVPVAPDGTISLATAGSAMDVAVDTVGWLAGTPASTPATASGAPSTAPSTTPSTTTAPDADTSGTLAGSPSTDADAAVADGGSLLWQADYAKGLAAYRSTPWNIVGAATPSVVSTAAGPGVEFTMPGGGQRAELEPNFRSLRDGDDLYFGFSVTLQPGFPASTDDWQVITQWKNDGTGSPPLSIKVGKGQFLLDGGFDRGAPFQLPMGAAVPGKTQTVVTHVRFAQGGGSVDTWVDGQQTIKGFTPPAGTLYSGTTSYLKTGIYRNTAISTPGSLVFDDWRIGTSYGSVLPR